MALRESTLQRIDEALSIVDEIEQEYKNKFLEIGLTWTGYGQHMKDVFDEAAKKTHYSASTLSRYRGERLARKGRFSNIKNEGLFRNNKGE